MGRNSKLSPAQWAEVERRAAAESRRALAREFGISDSTLREHLERTAARADAGAVDETTVDDGEGLGKEAESGAATRAQGAGQQGGHTARIVSAHNCAADARNDLAGERDAADTGPAAEGVAGPAGHVQRGRSGLASALGLAARAAAAAETARRSLALALAPRSAAG